MPLIGSTTKRSPLPDKLATLSDFSYDYDTVDEEERGYQRDAQDRDYEKSITPFHIYIWYREEGGQPRFFLEDTGNKEHYSQWQPGLQLEEGIWTKDYNYI